MQSESHQVFSSVWTIFTILQFFHLKPHILYKCNKKKSQARTIQGLKKNSLTLLLLSCSQLIFVIQFLPITLEKIIIVTLVSESRNWWMLHTTENPVWHQTWIKLNGFGELVAKLERDEEWAFIEESQRWRERRPVTLLPSKPILLRQ